MKLDIQDIERVNGASKEASFSGVPEGLASAAEGFEFDRTADFKGTATNVKGTIRLEGRLKTGYTVRCYRCLADVEGSMDIPISENFVNDPSRADEGMYVYEGDSIEIDSVLKDNIILNLPMKTVCSESCKGLCPVCGTDLNKNECSCSFEDEINPDMQILKSFFDK